MSKAQILFSKEDPYGYDSGVDINFDNHAIKLGSFTVDIDKCYPRGRAYWKLYNIQLENEGNKPWVNYD